ncbi:mediator of RNA polymerase II transcription subunit 1 isoform X2 [Drosophila tropicalis]|uniref:mediator of RNA polymerase II transcription subunit 1 isoform X2 n=1 Tax=Drosophila tropicalis TaxID=46794 RepID=UPI0035AB7B80
MSGNNAKGPSGSTAGAGGFGSHIPSIEEKNKQIQQETMMEKLRAKYRSKPKSYEEIKKSVRMYFIEKHYPLDPLCKATLQAALDKLQHYIKVTSRHGLVERLESLSRQLGLKFMEDQQLLFISTDMFYVEILLDSSGNLSDVKVHHECKIEQQSSELVNCLKSGDFADFTVQLEGLSSIYQLNAEPKVKKKAFVALQAMETDIYNLYQMQNHKGDDSYEIMNQSSVGLVLQRRGGHPMKLTYFCPPIHLPEGKAGTASPTNANEVNSLNYTIDQVMKSSHGLSATVNLEGSSANKLQIMPIVTFQRDAQSGIEVPTYAQLNQNNSMLMPATYVLRLNKPLPVCYESLRALGLPGVDGMANISTSASTSTTGFSSSTSTPPGPATTVLNLIVQTASKQAIRNTQRGLYVNLPKETHCYFFTDNRKLQGTLISSLPFTEPAQVPKIMAFLKKQALFYTLLSSCVREQQKQYNDMDSTVILEVTAVSFNQITVELQHPYEESLATVDFLLENNQVTCSIYCLSNDYEELSQKLTRTVRKVVSIPMVIYKLLKCWDEEHQVKLHGGIATGTSAGGAGGGAGSGLGGTIGGAAIDSTGKTSFNQFAMDTSTGVGLPDGSLPSGGFANVNNLKMDAKVRSLVDGFAASTSAAAAIAGLINLKRETDPEVTGGSSSSGVVGGSGSTATTGSSSSSGQAKASDQEIADKYKNIWKDKTPNLKHCVSITPIPGDAGKTGSGSAAAASGAAGTPSVGAVTGGGAAAAPPSVEVQRTGGIEIIPLNVQASVGGGGGGTASSSAAPTTITITPITGKDSSKEPSKKSSSSSSSGGPSGSGSVATKRPHESSSSSGSSSSSSSSSGSSSSSTGGGGGGGSSSSSSTDTQKEKKRKKKRDDSPMGPPEKVYSRQNSPAAGGDASTTSGVVRKFSSPSSSPKAGGAGGGLMSGVPPTRPSPKHSPVYSSPKHNTASNSPKSPFGTHSPKHGSSGKPSMSTLKSAATAATSLSPKGDKSSGSSGSTSVSGGSSSVTAVTSTGSGGNPSLVRSFASVSAPPPPPPVPPLSSSQQQAAAASAAAVSSSMKKEKSTSSGGGVSTTSSSAATTSAASSSSATSSSSSSVTNPANVVTPASVAAAVAALKTSQQQQQQQQQQQHQQQQQQQQQLKTSVASLSHLAAGFGTAGSIGGPCGPGGGAAGGVGVGTSSSGATAASALELGALRKGMAGGAFDDVDGSFNNNTPTGVSGGIVSGNNGSNLLNSVGNNSASGNGSTTIISGPGSGNANNGNGNNGANSIIHISSSSGSGGSGSSSGPSSGTNAANNGSNNIAATSPTATPPTAAAATSSSAATAATSAAAAAATSSATATTSTGNSAT